MKSRKIGIIMLELVGILIAFLFLMPMYFLLINSIKPFKDVMLSFSSFPKELYLGSFQKALKVVRLESTFFNSLFVTFFAVGGNLLMASMASYMLARTNTRLSWFLYLFFTFSLLVPFQAIMIPLTKLTVVLGLNYKLWGLILVYWGILTPFAIFVLHGFTKSVSLEIEEAAIIDGCSRFRMFFVIVLPLLKPALSSIAALNFLWVWNDFLLPMLLIFGRKEIYTIPLTQYNLYGQYNTQWDVATACVIIGIIPCLVFFLFMQKYIIRGITLGAVKG